MYAYWSKSVVFLVGADCLLPGGFESIFIPWPRLRCDGSILTGRSDVQISVPSVCMPVCWLIIRCAYSGVTFAALAINSIGTCLPRGNLVTIVDTFVSP